MKTHSPVSPEEFQDSLLKLNKDLKTAARTLGQKEARFLVDLYYQIQGARLAFADQVRKAAFAEPNAFLDFAATQMHTMERQVVAAMESYTDSQIVSQWAKKQYGIGPVLAAGLIARVDVARTTTAGGLWRLCGLDPTLVWGKGQKRPFNASLKVHAWRIGSSFWKFHNREKCYYGKAIAERWAYEKANNESGKLKPQAEETLATKNIKKTETREWYEKGMLPPGRILARAQRWGVKLFLAHWQQVLRESNGYRVPNPYAIDHLGHTHLITPPYWDAKRKVITNDIA